MENLSSNNKKEILEKVDEIVELIQNSKEYREYLQLEEKMKKHSRIPTLISEIKKLQREAVRKEAGGFDITEIEEEITHLKCVLNEIPLYLDFVEKQGKLNVSFTLIKETIDRWFQF